MFCKHDWEIISEKMTESKWEHTLKVLQTHIGERLNKGNIPWQLCDATRKLIQIVVCRKCGKIQKFVEYI
jgi:hypothetical protein